MNMTMIQDKCFLTPDRAVISGARAVATITDRAGAADHANPAVYQEHANSGKEAF